MKKNTRPTSKGPEFPFIPRSRCLHKSLKYENQLGNECQIIKHFLDDFHTFALKGWGCV